jgi:hypothetical protein
MNPRAKPPASFLQRCGLKPTKKIFTTNHRQSLRGLLTQRDDIITLLARDDAAAADRLSDFYIAYLKIMSSVQPTG